MISITNTNDKRFLLQPAVFCSVQGEKTIFSAMQEIARDFFSD